MFRRETLEEYSKNAVAETNRQQSFVRQVAADLKSEFCAGKHRKPGLLHRVSKLTGISVSTLFRRANPDSKSSEHAKRFSYEDATKVKAAIEAIRKHETN